MIRPRDGDLKLVPLVDLTVLWEVPPAEWIKPHPLGLHEAVGSDASYADDFAECAADDRVGDDRDRQADRLSCVRDLYHWTATLAPFWSATVAGAGALVDTAIPDNRRLSILATSSDPTCAVWIA